MDFTPDLPRLAHLDFSQNDLSELLWIWDHWNSDQNIIFSKKYGDIAHLLTVKIDEQPIRAMLEFWDPSYRCFSINQEDLTPTIEEYSVLLGIKLEEQDRIYVKEHKSPSIRKKLSKLFGIEILETDKYAVKKGTRECIPARFLLDFLEKNPDAVQITDVFALAIYGLVIFPRIIAHIDVGVLYFFMRLTMQINPVPTILAETIRALNFCRLNGKGRFTKCLSLFFIWVQSHIIKEERKPV